MDKITLDRINKLHPSIREEVKRIYLDVCSKLPQGYILRFTSTHRTKQEQDTLYLKRPKVTNAKGGQSIHNYGLAFDYVLIKDGVAKWDVNEVWKMVATEFKKHGYTWGGDWTSFKDYPHVEKSGYKWQDLISKETFTDGGIAYPKL